MSDLESREEETLPLTNKKDDDFGQSSLLNERLPSKRAAFLQKDQGEAYCIVGSWPLLIASVSFFTAALSVLYRSSTLTSTQQRHVVQKSSFPQHQRPQVLFGYVHIAKTAGSTVNAMLSMHFERVCGTKATVTTLIKQMNGSEREITPSSKVTHIELM